jgi:hypothetical protein
MGRDSRSTRRAAAEETLASNLSDDLRSGALIYHRLPRPGKLEIQATKPRLPIRRA